MQKPCFLAATRRVEFLDRKKFATLALHKSERTVMVPTVVFTKSYLCFLQSLNQFFTCEIGSYYCSFQTYQFY